MKVMSFRKYLEENTKDVSYDVVKLGYDSKGIDNDTTRQTINSSLTKATAHAFLTPYIGYGIVCRILAYAGIILPQYIFLDKEEAETVFDCAQYGQQTGLVKTDVFGDKPYELQVPPDTGDYSVYFHYAMNPKGCYDIYAQVVDAEELAKLLAADEEMDEISESVEFKQEDKKRHDDLVSKFKETGNREHLSRANNLRKVYGLKPLSEEELEKKNLEPKGYHVTYHGMEGSDGLRKGQVVGKAKSRIRAHSIADKKDLEYGRIAHRVVPIYEDNDDVPEAKKTQAKFTHSKTLDTVKKRKSKDTFTSNVTGKTYQKPRRAEPSAAEPKSHSSWFLRQDPHEHYENHLDAFHKHRNISRDVHKHSFDTRASAEHKMQDHNEKMESWKRHPNFKTEVAEKIHKRIGDKYANQQSEAPEKKPESPVKHLDYGRTNVPKAKDTNLVKKDAMHKAPESDVRSPLETKGSKEAKGAVRGPGSMRAFRA